MCSADVEVDVVVIVVVVEVVVVANVGNGAACLPQYFDRLKPYFWYNFFFI